jgi:hypothetical protein
MEDAMDSKSGQKRDSHNAPHVSENIHGGCANVKDNRLFSNMHHKRNYRIQVYQNSVEFIVPKDSTNQQSKPVTKRSSISSFSRRSRFRLFRLLSQLENINDRKTLFVTLTYHHNWKETPRKAQRDFHHFLTRLRNFDTDVSYIWRIELQRRGAPHFHLILLPGQGFDKSPGEKYIATLASMWHSIADPDSRAHKQYGVKIDKINDYTMACAYLSKYIAKVDDTDKKDVGGRHWGASRNLPRATKTEIVCNDREARIYIEALRHWLLSAGRKRYIDNDYFRADYDQTIFMPSEAWEEVEEIADYIRSRSSPDWTARDCDAYWDRVVDRHATSQLI